MIKPFLAVSLTAPLLLPLPTPARNAIHLERIKHIVVIYQENWSFDSLYGHFPGANGVANAGIALPQLNPLAAPAFSSNLAETPQPLDGDGAPDLVACVEWSVYPFYRNAALRLPARPELRWGPLQVESR